MADEIRTLPLSCLIESPTNPRKTHQETGLQEMAETIKQVGVMQPILVRPIFDYATEDPRYEIVFGHRRFRASMLAGVDEIRAMVREMDDNDVAIAQLIENIQREDVNPVEEADAFVALIKQHKVSADDIAAQTGQSRTQIYNRLKLASASEQVREACLVKGLPAEIATDIARLPKSLQGKALSAVSTSDDEDDAAPVAWMPTRRAKESIRAGFTLTLEGAPFDIDDDTLGIGACTNCPSFSNNDEAYLQDLGASVCTDKPCFETKISHLIEIKKREAQEQGRQVIDGDAARRAMPSAYSTKYMNGYRTVDSTATASRGADDEIVTVTYRQLIEQLGDPVKPALLVNPHRGPSSPALTFDVLPMDEVQRLQALVREQEREERIQANGADQPDDEDGDENDEEVDTRPPEARAVASWQGWAAVRRQIISKIRTQARTKAELVLIILALVDAADEVPELVAEAWGWTEALKQACYGGDIEFVRTQTLAMSPDELCQLLVALALERHPVRYGEEHLADKLELARSYGVDVLQATDPDAEKTASPPSTAAQAQEEDPTDVADERCTRTLELPPPEPAPAAAYEGTTWPFPTPKHSAAKVPA